MFDPYLSAHIETLVLENIRVNGERSADPASLVRCVSFDDVNADGMSDGIGSIGDITIG